MQTFAFSAVRLFLAVFLAAVFFPAGAAAQGNPADGRSTDELTEALARRRLAADDLMPYHRVEVSIVDGVATLTGTARTRQARDAIVSEVRKIAGVSSVQDRIEVQPTP